MTGKFAFTTASQSNRCARAAACSSALLLPLLDTAVLLVVSICVLVRIIMT